MNYLCRIVIEALLVALSIVALGYLLQSYCKIREPLLLLFVTGFLIHIMYDVVGFNKYYCKICAGCK